MSSLLVVGNNVVGMAGNGGTGILGGREVGVLLEGESINGDDAPTLLTSPLLPPEKASNKPISKPAITKISVVINVQTRQSFSRFQNVV